jgi:NAD(P)-dependent dehydrogenase (short-subunit alcohol dehydrogenase family)
MDVNAKRTALVTGGSSGIGLAIARALAEEGYDLTIAARGMERLRVAEHELAELGAAVEIVAANVADEQDIIDLLARHRARFGRLDVLVNNAGMGVRGAIDGYATKYIDLQLSVNLRAMMLCYREAMDLLLAAGAEHREALVINVSSFSGKAGAAELGVYAATKHGIVGFNDSMNRELYPAGIRCCVLCPGFVDTAMSDYVKPHVPPEAMIVPSDLAAAVRFLLALSPACLVPELVFMQGEALELKRAPALHDGHRAREGLS